MLVDLELVLCKTKSYSLDALRFGQIFNLGFEFTNLNLCFTTFELESSISKLELKPTAIYGQTLGVLIRTHDS